MYPKKLDSMHWLLFVARIKIKKKKKIIKTIIAIKNDYGICFIKKNHHIFKCAFLKAIKKFWFKKHIKK